jgi:hypothetical protein
VDSLETAEAWTMRGVNRDTWVVLLVVALIAAFDLFRPAPAATQVDVNAYMRDVVNELRGIRRELSSIERKLK